MDNTPEIYIQRLMDASVRKLKLLQEILNRTLEQAASISRNEIESLQKAISQKQIKIDEIDKIDEEFKVYFCRFKSILKVKSLDELQNSKIAGVKELQNTIEQIMEILNEINSYEQKNNHEAQKLLNNFKNEIKTINQGKKVSIAYTPGYNMRPPSYFIDKKK